MGGRVFTCMLLGAMAWGQATSSAPRQGAVPPGAAAVPLAKPAEAAPVSPDFPVITIQGLCDAPSTNKNSTDCTTVITRAEFEETLNAVQPNLPAAQRRQFGSNYAMLLVMAHEARKLGLDDTPSFKERLRLMRLQLEMQQFGETAREKASQISDAEVTDFYQSHAGQYEEAKVQILIVPRTKQSSAAKPKTGAVAAKSAPADPEGEMKKEAEALRVRAAAGEDFAKLEAEAYSFAGSKEKLPETSKTFRRGNLPPTQAMIMDLKPGEVSPVISEPIGHFVYRMENKETAPLDKVRSEVREAVKAQKMQATVQSLQQSVTPKLDDKYFGAPAASLPAGHPSLAAPAPAPSGRK
jgi:hypothetical protein